jgi:hypothetical protein
MASSIALVKGIIALVKGILAVTIAFVEHSARAPHLASASKFAGDL